MFEEVKIISVFMGLTGILLTLAGSIIDFFPETWRLTLIKKAVNNVRCILGGVPIVYECTHAILHWHAARWAPSRDWEAGDPTPTLILSVMEEFDGQSLIFHIQKTREDFQ
ncbi:hypothetical protein K439DRAFT_1566286 [Ramaria rubella]|nr:hypothetical protein K439DRAFT_1566286 [Ramaria rubella]